MEQGKTNKKKDVGLILIMMLAVLVIVVSLSLAYYAWAKYISSEGGRGVADVAKWHFELKTGEEQTSGETIFAITRTDGYDHIAEGQLAPGTYGEIPIEVDTTYTEVATLYDITLQLVDCPKNVTFYSDSQKTTLLPKIKQQMVINGEQKEVDIVQVSKYLPVDEVSDVHDETIYWKWPYHISNADDQEDNADQGKTVLMTIIATGTEVMSDPNSIGYKAMNGEIKVGDYVRYDPLVGLSEDDLQTEGIGKYTVKGASSGMSYDEEENIEHETNWIYLGTNSRGEIEVAAVPVGGFSLKGEVGYMNGPTIIENVAKLYGQGKGAVGARSITTADIEKLTNFNKNESSYEGYDYGSEETYTFNNLSIPIEVDGQVISNGDTKTVHQEFYTYRFNNETIKDEAKLYSIPSMLFNGRTYFLPERVCALQSGGCLLGLRGVKGGSYGFPNSSLYASAGYQMEARASIGVVVSIDPNTIVKKSPYLTFGCGDWTLE